MSHKKAQLIRCIAESGRKSLVVCRDLNERQWPIKKCISPMMIHKFSFSVDYNYNLKRLDTQLNEPTYQKSIKSC